jgi:hypothetical protein
MLYFTKFNLNGTVLCLKQVLELYTRYIWRRNMRRASSCKHFSFSFFKIVVYNGKVKPLCFCSTNAF